MGAHVVALRHPPDASLMQASAAVKRRIFTGIKRVQVCVRLTVLALTLSLNVSLLLIAQRNVLSEQQKGERGFEVEVDSPVMGLLCYTAVTVSIPLFELTK